MKQGIRLKFIFACMLLFLLPACGEDQKNTVGDTNAAAADVTPVISEVATQDNAGPDENGDVKENESSRNEKDKTVYDNYNGAFRFGTWAMKDSHGKYSFISYFRNGKILVHEIKNGSVTEYEKENLPAYYCPEKLEQMDEDRIYGFDAEENKTEFNYVSEKTENFTFYTDEKLCEMMKEKFVALKKAKAENVKAEIEREDCDKAVIVLSAGTVRERYEADRFSGEGKRINEE